MARPVRIVDVGFVTENVAYRTPIKFGGVALDRATLLKSWVTVEAGGRSALGRGAMPLGNVWAFPSQHLNYDETLGVMGRLAELLSAEYYNCPLTGHPVEITSALEIGWPALGQRLLQRFHPGETLPYLAVLVAASAFDAALHDAYGKLFGLSSYRTLGPEFLGRDLTSFLGPEFNGLFLDRFVRPEPVAELPLYHLVGALDPLMTSEVTTPVGDGLPETLGEWIERDGLTHIKIKLSGDDPAWDLERVRAVDAVTRRIHARLEIGPRVYSLDFNERCPSAAALVDFLNRLEEEAPTAYGRVQYIEQPMTRHLADVPDQRVHEAAALKPVVIDEALIGLESLHLARKLGYTGVALKACKGHTQSLLLAAAAQKMGMFLCVQDLTCPGASFVHSAGLAAHIPGVAAIEGNARQYCPAANIGWEQTHPGLFSVADGRVRTGELSNHGLSAYPPEAS